MKDEVVGWECTNCGLQFEKNLRYCPRCSYTVYRPVWKSEKK